MSKSKERSMSKGRLPDFIVVGATKAGTTSLDRYLSMHPEIHMAKPKEPRFFSADAPNSNYHRGLDWYRSLFRSELPRCGETSPQYTQWPSRSSGVVERMHAVIPNCRLVYLVREPWSRIKSHYRMSLRDGKTTLDFGTYLSRTPHATDASRYGTQLARLMSLFPAEQILVLESDRLRSQTRNALREVFKFLEVDADFDSPGFDHRYNVGEDRRTLSTTDRHIMKSTGVRVLKRYLSDWAFYHFRQTIPKPFLVPESPLDLPEPMKRDLYDIFQREVELLRRLTRQELPSLEIKESA